MIYIKKLEIISLIEGYVFINMKTVTRYKSILKTFDRAVRKLDLRVNGTKLRFHDLRHVYATWLLKAGVSLDVIRELLGHRDVYTTSRYATLDRKEVSHFLDYLPKIKNPDHGKVEVC